MPSPKSKAEAEAEAKVRSWGFSHVFTWTDRPHAHYPPHSHAGRTTHLILKGDLTAWYLDDAQGDGSPGSPRNATPREKMRLRAGMRWDVEAGRIHEVVVGDEGCVYVIGE